MQQAWIGAFPGTPHFPVPCRQDGDPAHRACTDPRLLLKTKISHLM